MDEQSTAPKPFVFVLMPFAPEFDDVYELGIKAACTGSGMHCERVDEQIFEGTILERIYNQIAKADVIVADMTGRNPNVFYETGYAHALGKRVVLLTQTPDDIPFDMKHYPHIIYERRITNLKQQLERRLAWFAKNPAASRVPNEGLEIFLDNEPLPGLSIPVQNPGSVGFQLNIHNAGPTVVNSVNLALIVDGEIAVVEVDGPSALRSDLPDGRRLFRLPVGDGLLPDEWTTAYVIVRREHPTVRGSASREYEEARVPVTLRIYYETGPRDLEFVLDFPSGPIRV